MKTRPEYKQRPGQSRLARRQDRSLYGAVTFDLRGLRNVVPDRIRVVLPYSESLNRAPAATSEDYQWNLNSLFDPNRTGTGHQPLGNDQWAAFYNRYRVLSTFVRVTYNNVSSGTCNCVIAATNSTTNLTFLAAMEQPYSRTALLSPATGSRDAVVLREKFDLARVNGMTGPQYMYSDLVEATFGTTPTENIILHTVVESISGINVVYTVQVYLEYYVELWDPLELTES